MQFQEHGVEGLSAKKRGPAPKATPCAREIQLEGEKRKLEKRLAKAEAIIAFPESARAPGDPLPAPRTRRGRKMQAVAKIEERHLKAGRMWVTDRGMCNESNLEWLREGGRE
jgi:hypothetical protein